MISRPGENRARTAENDTAAGRHTTSGAFASSIVHVAVVTVGGRLSLCGLGQECSYLHTRGIPDSVLPVVCTLYIIP